MAKRKQYSPEFKFKAVLEILKGEKTAAQLGGELNVHPIILSAWKRHFLEVGPECFDKGKKASTAEQEIKERTELYEQIGRLKMESEWLKKKLGALS